MTFDEATIKCDEIQTKLDECCTRMAEIAIFNYGLQEKLGIAIEALEQISNIACNESLIAIEALEKIK